MPVLHLQTQDLAIPRLGQSVTCLDSLISLKEQANLTAPVNHLQGPPEGCSKSVWLPIAGHLLA